VKVDIIGHYQIPALKLTAPANGVELNWQEIKYLLGYKNLLVLVANTSIMIDLRNLNMLYQKYNGKQLDTPEKQSYVEPIITVEKNIEKVIEQPATPVVEEVVEKEEEVDTSSDIIEQEVTVNDTTEDGSNDKKPLSDAISRKKNKRRRNHNG
jgi:hypothetical protein